MNYSLLIGVVLLNIIAEINTMEEKKPKTIHNIKLRGLSQGNLTLPKPLDTANKRPSPRTEKVIADAQKKDALPRRFSDPEIKKLSFQKNTTSSDEKK